MTLACRVDLGCNKNMLGMSSLVIKNAFSINYIFWFVIFQGKEMILNDSNTMLAKLSLILLYNRKIQNFKRYESIVFFIFNLKISKFFTKCNVILNLLLWCYCLIFFICWYRYRIHPNVLFFFHEGAANCEI